MAVSDSRDSGSEKPGESPHYQLEKSLFKSPLFKQPFCRFRDLTLYKQELVEFLLDRGKTRGQTPYTLRKIGMIHF